MKPTESLGFKRLRSYDTILITKKSSHILKYIPKKRLQRYNKNIEITKEALLILISFFSKSIILYKNNNNLIDANINLNKVILKSIFGKNYKVLVDILLEGTNTPIIELVCDYSHGNHSRVYRMAERYLNNGFNIYVIKQPKFLKVFKKQHDENIKRLIKSNNPIINNLFIIYNTITLPTTDEIKERGNELVKMRHITKSGKRLRKGIKNKKAYNNSSWLEDHLDIFNYLITSGLLMPKITRTRIIDSLSLLPSWIRDMITIGGEKLKESDYSTLHPNLLLNEYGSEEEKNTPITHDKIATELNKTRIEIKKEHISYFNDKLFMMKNYKMNNYYEQNYPVMLYNIKQDKQNYGYKITSLLSMVKETEIMSKVVYKLNKIGVYVIYVYDALLCRESDYILVKEIMNREGENYKIKI